MTDSPYGLPDGVEDTATREMHLAEDRVRRAHEEEARSHAVVGLLAVALEGARDLHLENGYAPKLRAIFRS